MRFPSNLPRPLAMAALAVAVLVPGACGFQPVYSEQRNASAATLASIAIAPIEDRRGQQLRNLLKARLSPKGPADRALYRLTVKLTEAKAELALRKDERATRANMTVSASFTLTDLRAPTVKDRRQFVRSAQVVRSYNILDSTFATLAAENDARSRAISEIAEEIRVRLAIWLRQQPQ